MKTPIKLTLAAVLASVVATAGAFADDLKIVQIYNNHGSSALVYRVAEPSTVAVYANGGSVGQPAASQTQTYRYQLRPNNHGLERSEHVAQ